MQLNVPQDHDHASTSLKTVLLIFVIVLIGALAYLVFAQNAEPDTTDYSAPSVKKTDSTASTPTAETDVTADWKTYNNTALGFSLRHPVDYEVKDLLQVAGEASASQQLVIEKPGLVGAPRLTMWVNPAGFGGAPTNLLYSFNAEADGTLSIIDKVKQEGIGIGEFGYDGTRQTAGTYLSGISVQGKTFVFQFSYDTGNDSLLEVFESIMSTFKAT